MNKIRFTRTNTEELLAICMDRSYGAYFEYDNKEDKMILNLEKLGKLCARIEEGTTLTYTDDKITVSKED